MSEHTAGAVVDIVTRSGLRPAILTNVGNSGFTGYLVDHTHHHAITDPVEGLREEILFPHEDERGLVVESQYGKVVVFKDTDGIYVCVAGDEGRGRFVKSPAGTLKVIRDFLYSLEDYDLARDLKSREDFYIPYLASILDEELQRA